MAQKNILKNEQLIVGVTAPEFTLFGSDDKEHRLSDYRGKRVILYFYPKDTTPAWTTEAESFRDNVLPLERLNSVVLGVSRDSLSAHDKFVEKLGLPFVLLSDPQGNASQLYGVLKEKNMYGKISIGIERATFIISETGTIDRIYRKVKVAGHVDDIIAYLNILH